MLAREQDTGRGASFTSLFLLSYLSLSSERGGGGLAGLSGEGAERGQRDDRERTERGQRGEWLQLIRSGGETYQTLKVIYNDG